jgi:hypothetical protein
MRQLQQRSDVVMRTILALVMASLGVLVVVMMSFVFGV